MASHNSPTRAPALMVPSEEHQAQRRVLDVRHSIILAILLCPLLVIVYLVLAHIQPCETYSMRRSPHASLISETIISAIFSAICYLFSMEIFFSWHLRPSKTSVVGDDLRRGIVFLTDVGLSCGWSLLLVYFNLHSSIRFILLFLTTAFCIELSLYLRGPEEGQGGGQESEKNEENAEKISEKEGGNNGEIYVEDKVEPNSAPQNRRLFHVAALILRSTILLSGNAFYIPKVIYKAINSGEDEAVGSILTLLVVELVYLYLLSALSGLLQLLYVSLFNLSRKCLRPNSVALASVDTIENVALHRLEKILKDVIIGDPNAEFDYVLFKYTQIQNVQPSPFSPSASPLTSAQQAKIDKPSVVFMKAIAALPKVHEFAISDISDEEIISQPKKRHSAPSLIASSSLLGLGDEDLKLIENHTVSLVLGYCPWQYMSIRSLAEEQFIASSDYLFDALTLSALRIFMVLSSSIVVYVFSQIREILYNIYTFAVRFEDAFELCHAELFHLSKDRLLFNNLSKIVMTGIMDHVVFPSGLHGKASRVLKRKIDVGCMSSEIGEMLRFERIEYEEACSVLMAAGVGEEDDTDGGGPITNNDNLNGRNPSAPSLLRRHRWSVGSNKAAGLQGGIETARTQTGTSSDVPRSNNRRSILTIQTGKDQKTSSSEPASSILVNRKSSIYGQKKTDLDFWLNKRAKFQTPLKHLFMFSNEAFALSNIPRFFVDPRDLFPTNFAAYGGAEITEVDKISADKVGADDGKSIFPNGTHSNATNVDTNVHLSDPIASPRNEQALARLNRRRGCNSAPLEHARWTTKVLTEMQYHIKKRFYIRIQSKIVTSLSFLLIPLVLILTNYNQPEEFGLQISTSLSHPFAFYTNPFTDLVNSFSTPEPSKDPPEFSEGMDLTTNDLTYLKYVKHKDEGKTFRPQLLLCTSITLVFDLLETLVILKAHSLSQLRASQTFQDIKYVLSPTVLIYGLLVSIYAILNVFRSLYVGPAALCLDDQVVSQYGYFGGI